MRFNVVINQQKCVQYNLNVNQAALMALLNEIASWATEKVIKGKTYWHISRNKVVEEIPLFYSKPDTVYRAFKYLSEENMIEYIQQQRMDFVRLTPKGKMWNKLGSKSELGNESAELGNSSEFNVLPNPDENQEVKPPVSEMNPTYNIHNNTSNNIYTSAYEFLEKNAPSELEIILMKYKSKIKDFEAFKVFYNCKVVEESLEWENKILLARIERMASTWVGNAQKDAVHLMQKNGQGAVIEPVAGKRTIFTGK